MRNSGVRYSKRGRGACRKIQTRQGLGGRAVTWERKTLNQEQRECTDLLANLEGRERQPPVGNATLQVRRASRITKKNSRQSERTKTCRTRPREGPTESPESETDIPRLGRQQGEPREGEGTEREPHPPQAEEGGPEIQRERSPQLDATSSRRKGRLRA